MDMVILIDNGHGAETPGKRSPDGRLREYRYAREIARRVAAGLRGCGLDARLLVEEEADIPLSIRCKRVNAVCREEGAGRVLLVSIHNNAAGADGQWHDARGWQACVSLNASTRSKRLACHLFDAASEQGLRLRQPGPGKKWWAQNLAICRETQCAAVLTENLFQDNRGDVGYLLSEAGRAAIAALHVNGITDYIKDMK